MVTKHVYILALHGQVAIGMCQQGEAERQRQSKQVNFTQDNSSKEKELPLAGFEPTTLCRLGERSTN